MVRAGGGHTSPPAAAAKSSPEMKILPLLLTLLLVSLLIEWLAPEMQHGPLGIGLAEGIVDFAVITAYLLVNKSRSKN